MRLLSTAPAKLILSGEHAVVYGQPALSQAINLPTTCELDFTPQPHDLTITLRDFGITKHTSFNQAWLDAERIHQRFIDFQQQLADINTVCQTPFDLVLLSLFHFNNLYPIEFKHLKINIQSQAWSGRGLGSSAAVITSLLKGLWHAHQKNNTEGLHSLATLIESYQHGQSSGIDPAALLSSGLIRYQQNQPIQTLTTSPKNFWLIDTGQPESHTGECVQHVRTHHANNRPLWQAFANCTEEMQNALISDNPTTISQMINQNQRLLEQIGVVPKNITTFAKQLNEVSLATKVCGAGSVQGKRAGVMLAYSQTELDHNAQQQLNRLCQAYGYRLQQVRTANQPTHCKQIYDN
jgi:mevalonate kinase